MINSLKRLSGATRVVQDDFNKGVGVFRVICQKPPAVKIGDVKQQLGRYKLDKVEFKVTGKLSKKSGDKLYIGKWLLENPTGDNAPDNLAKCKELQKAKKVVILWGLVKEEKGKQTLAVNKVLEYKKK